MFEARTLSCLFCRIWPGFARSREALDQADAPCHRRVRARIAFFGPFRGQFGAACPVSLVVAGALAASLLVSQQSAAADNFIQLYITAQGGCGKPGWDPLSFVLIGQKLHAPFGKAAEDWSDDDLASLKTALAACQATVEGGGNPYMLEEVRRESNNLLTRIPQIVAQARDQAQAQTDQIQATRERQIAAEKQAAANKLAALQRAADAQADQRKALEARKAAEADELKAATRLAEESEARARDAKAEAQARYGVEAAKHRAAEAEAQTRNADAQARADRDAADQRVREAHAQANASPPSTQPPSNSAHAGDTIGTGQRTAQTGADREQSPTVPGVTTDNYVACKMLNELITSTQAIVRGDGDTGAALVNAGECFLIPKGTSVRVKAADAQADDPKVACVFIEGHFQCLWMPTNVLEGADK